MRVRIALGRHIKKNVLTLSSGVIKNWSTTAIPTIFFLLVENPTMNLNKPVQIY